MHDAILSVGGTEFLVVGVGGQRFALDVQTVREIRGWSTFTPVPHAPDFVLGMINLRGAVLPVIDLGGRLGRGPTEVTSASVVVVVEISQSQAGLLVDEVCDIVSVAASEIQAAPDFGVHRGLAAVNGMVTTAEGILTLLDPAVIVPQMVLAAA